MPESIIEKWWPVTYDYGLIKAEVTTVIKARSAMYREENTFVDVLAVKGGLEDFFHALEPLSPAPTKEMYLATNFGWTAFFRNATRGSDPFVPMFQLSKKLGVTAMRICVSPANNFYQSVIWEVYERPGAGGDEWGYRRSIAAANDGGRWVFHQSGEPYSFEDLDAYKARLKKRRFTKEILHEYLRNFGIPPLTDSAFAGCKNAEKVMLFRPDHVHLNPATLSEFLTNNS